MLLLYTLAVIGAGALPVVLLRILRLEKFPRSAINEFVARLKTGPVAHRGGKPENTLAAFRLAKSQGASGVEVDMVLSKDGHPVLLHDNTVDRTSNGSGRVDGLTLKELKALDFGVKAGIEFTGECIPTLSEALDVCEKLDLLMFLELKDGSNKSVEVVQRLFTERPTLYNRVCVISFYPNIIYKLRRADSNLLTGIVHRSDYISYTPDGQRRTKNLWKYIPSVLADWLLSWCLNTWIWKVVGVSLLLVNKDDVLNKHTNVDQWNKRGVSLMAWTVNEVEEKEHFENVLKIPYLTDYVTNTN